MNARDNESTSCWSVRCSVSILAVAACAWMYTFAGDPISQELYCAPECQCTAELHKVGEYDEVMPPSLANIKGPQIEAIIPTLHTGNKTIVRPGEIIVVTALEEFPGYKAWTHKTCGPIVLRSKQLEPDSSGYGHNVKFFFQVDYEAAEANLSISFKRVIRLNGLESFTGRQRPIDWSYPDDELFLFVSDKPIDDQSLTQANQTLDELHNVTDYKLQPGDRFTIYAEDLDYGDSHESMGKQLQYQTLGPIKLVDIEPDQVGVVSLKFEVYPDAQIGQDFYMNFTSAHFALDKGNNLSDSFHFIVEMAEPQISYKEVATQTKFLQE